MIVMSLAHQSNTSNIFSIRLKSGDLEHGIYIIFILNQPFSEPSYPMSGGTIIQEENIPIWIKMFNHRIKVIRQNNFVWFAVTLPNKWTQTMAEK